MHRLIARAHADWLPLAIVGGGTVFLHWHLWPWWSAGWGASGVLLALVLDAICLWLWYARGAWVVPAALMSVVLLGGPFVSATAPLAAAWDDARAEAAAAPARIALVREEIATQERNLETFRANSRARAGWLPAIQAAEAALTAKRAELATLLEQPADRSTTALLLLQVHGTTLLFALALVAVELGRVGALVSLSRRGAAASSPPAPVAKLRVPSQPVRAPEISAPRASQLPESTGVARVSPPAPDPARPAGISGAERNPATPPATSQPVASFGITPFVVRRLRDLVEAEVERTSGTDLCRRAAIEPSDLSCFRKWAANEKVSRRPSKASVQRLAALLLPQADRGEG